MPKRRVILGVVVLLLLVGVTVVVWKVADWPPPRLLLKYGFPPTGGPTGRTKVIEGIEFVEVSEGFCRLRRGIGVIPANWLGRICEPLGLPWGDWSLGDPVYTRDEWVEIPAPLWVSRRFVPHSEFSEGTPQISWSMGGATVPPRPMAEHWCGEATTRIGGSLRLGTCQEVFFSCETSAVETPDKGHAWWACWEHGWFNPVLLGPDWEDFQGSYSRGRDLMFSDEREIEGFLLVWIPPEDE